MLAAIAMVALGIGIGFSVWGGSAPAVAKQRVTVPSPRISPTTGRGFPFTRIGRGGFLGVEIATTSTLTTSSGAYVKSVVPSSPAAKAGIVKGDRITEFDTKTVKTASALEVDVPNVPPGTQVKVGWVTSAGKHESATVTLASRTTVSSLG